jgi:dipeptidyl aminopeptidase/acylaminoacyl peptidase
MRSVLFGFVLVVVAPPMVAGADSAATLRVTDGGFQAPRFSPDGKALLVTGPDWKGLWLVDLDGETRRIATDDRAGLSARFLADGRVAYDARRAGALRTVAVDDDGAVRGVEVPAPAAFAHGDRIYVRTPDGTVRVGAGDRFFGPTMSPDGRRVAFVGLATGIHVHDLDTGETVDLGPGTAPAWSPDGAALAFERTEDDGHEIVASDIWVWQGGAPVAAIADAQRLERRPAWSPDGRAIAFDDGAGAIYVAEVQR